MRFWKIFNLIDNLANTTLKTLRDYGEKYELCNLESVSKLTHSMVYETRRFNAVFSRPLQYFLSLAKSTQFLALTYMSLNQF